MRARDYLKKRYDKNRNNEVWKEHKNARNDVNNIIKLAKCDYLRLAKCDPRPHFVYTQLYTFILPLRNETT